MFKVKYVEFIMMLVRLDLNLIVSLFHHKCEVSETVSTTTLERTQAQSEFIFVIFMTELKKLQLRHVGF